MMPAEVTVLGDDVGVGDGHVIREDARLHALHGIDAHLQLVRDGCAVGVGDRHAAVGRLDLGDHPAKVHEDLLVGQIGADADHTVVVHCKTQSMDARLRPHLGRHTKPVRPKAGF